MSLSSRASSKAPNMWEMLKKDARKIEGELEMKLSQYSRVSSGLDSSSSRGPEAARAQQGAAQMEADIAHLLKRLGEVHGSMEADVAGSDVRQHTVTRHREILQDFSQEFRRMTVQMSQARDCAQLLSGAKDVTPLLDVSVDTTASSLIRERNHLGASTAAIDGVLSQAGHVGASLRDQGGLFDNISTKLTVVGAKFPVVNGLMNAIRRRKSRDTIVVTAVVVSCSLLFFWYVFRRWFH